MNLARRRAFLEGIAESAESDHVRLRALDQLDRLDSRERPEPPKRPDSSPEALADDPAWLARTSELFLELGLADAAIEERAQAIAAERLRKTFAVVETTDRGIGQDEPEPDAGTEMLPAPFDEMREYDGYR